MPASFKRSSSGLCRQWRRIFRGDRRGECQDLDNLGIVYYRLGEARKAIENHARRLAIARARSATTAAKAMRYDTRAHLTSVRSRHQLNRCLFTEVLLYSSSDEVSMIPKRIHYCWFGETEPNSQIKQCMESWRRLLPGYEFRRWHPDDLPMDLPYLQCVWQQQLWPKVANFVRLYALYEQGGIYLDMDIEVLRSFDPLLADECFLGFQQRHRNSDWVNNAVMGAARGNRFVIRCLETMLDEFDRRRAILRGPQCTTAVLIQMGLCRYGDQSLQGVRVCRSDYFYPYPWWANYHPLRVKPYA